MTTDLLLNDFAIRCFRDIGDGDYISARLAYRAGLTVQFLWASEQVIEKYLKCVLLLNRIPARDIGHDLERALTMIAGAGKIALDLTSLTRKFIAYIDAYGRYRYLEASPYCRGRDIVGLDRTVWELRRYCTPEVGPRQIRLRDGVLPPKIRIEGGHLEKIMDEPRDPAREPLLWQNAFFGKRARRGVRVWGGFTAINSPLFLNPYLLDEVEKYVHLPKEIKIACREAAKKRLPTI